MAKREAERYGMAVVEKYRDNAYNTMSKYNLDTRSQWQKDFDQNYADFNNYLDSGNYSVDNNKKYRDMATQAVADLDAQMKRYGTNSNEYKTLKGYKTYYQNALPTFDRLDVGANVQDYLSYDQDKGFTNWHSQDDYNTQKSYLDQQRQAVQSSIAAEEKKLKDSGATTSADLESMKSWQAQLDEYGKLIDARNEFDKGFETADDFAAYERSFDYKNTMQAAKTLEQQRADLEAKQAKLTQLEMKFGQSKNNANIWLQNAANAAQGIDTNTNTALEMTKDPEGYQRMLDLQKETEALRDNVSKLEEDLGKMQYYQDISILNNYGKYDPKVNWEEIVDEQKDARNKAEQTYGKDSEEYAKIDRQIKFLAGENEDGTGQDGLFSDDSYLGRYKLQGIDVEAERKKYEDLEQQLKDRGAATTASESWWKKLGTAAQSALDAQINPWGSAESAAQNAETYALETDQDIVNLRSQKQDLNQRIQSAEKYQNRADKENKYNALGETTQAELIDAAKGAISEDGKGYTDANGRYHRVDRLEYLTDDMEPELRNQIYAAIGAEILGKDIGYTVDEITDAYKARMNQAAGYTWGKKLHDMDSDFWRWNAQVLGTGTQAGVWQFGSGMKQFFTEDMVEPSAMSAMAQYTRNDLKRYGNEQILAGASQGGSNISQLMFDTAQTTGNMLPMIITSALLTKAGAPEIAAELVGAGMMSMSSAGNTYQQALAEGWEKEDARTFAAITGAAEGAMQYLIGGISELGGLSEEKLLGIAQRINDAGLRFATETGVHILSETTEELAQNRLESYLRSQFRGEDFTWWDDDDWYTVIVTALSTGAMEGPKVGLQIHRDTQTGKALTGTPIQSKALTANQRQWNETVNKVGKLLGGDVAARESLLSFATDPELVEEGGNAYKLATYMKEHPNRVNDTNIGRLYAEIISEYQQANKKSGVQAAMSGIIGGAIQYHSGQKLQTEVQAADERAAEIRRANPNATVLDLNASELAKAGVEEAAAKEYGIILNKVMSGTDLTETEIKKLTDGSTAAEVSLRLLDRMSEYKETSVKLRLDKASAAEGIREMVQQFRTRKEELAAAKQTAITEAQRDAVAKAQVNEEVLGAEPGNPVFGTVQDLVDADTVSAMQKADADKASAERKLAQLESMSPDTRRSLGQAAMLEDENAEYAGVTEALVGSEEIKGLMQQAEGLEETIEKLRSVKFPSRQQSMELADAREQLARVNSQIQQLQGQQVAQAVARAKTQEEAKAQPAAAAQGEAARNSSGADGDTIKLPGVGEKTRAEFVQEYLEKHPEATREQANELFEKRAAETGGYVKKGTVEKAKPERAKLTGKVEYWNGGALEGTNYDQVNEAEARELLGDANMAFLEKVLTKVANVTLIKSRLENGKYVGANGIFYRDGRIYLDVNAEMDFGERGIVLAAAHELTHFIAEYNNPAFLKLKDFVLNELKNKGMPLDERIKDQQARYKATTGKELSREKAEEEVVADACEMMLTDADAIKRFAAENPTEAKTILDWLTDFFNQIADAFKDLVAVHPEAKALQEQTNQIREMWLNALVEADANAAKASIDKLSDGGQKIVESLGQDTTIQVDANGDMALAQSEDGKTIAFSMKTYEDSGKRKLIQALKENGHTQEEIDAVVENIEATGDFLVKVAQQFSDSHGYNNLMKNLWAGVTTNIKTGKQAISTLVNNGDYPVNMDLQLICKKRVAYMRMLTRLIDDGVFEKVDFKGSAIADLNAVLRDGGFETACLGCFVESRRLQLQAWAETIVEEWNSAVDKRNPQAGDFNFAKGGNALSNMEIAGLITELENAGQKNDKGNLNLGKGAVEEKMGRLLDKVPSLVQHLTVADLLTPQGMSTLRSYDQNLFSLVKQRYGAASPKIVQDFNAYNSEIADLSFKFVKDMIGESVKGSAQYTDQVKKTLKQRIGESKAAYNRRVETEAMRKYLYDIGGARIQSFSDFMIENVFDYLQIVADLSAREFPLHGYSKEAIFLRLFGMTGGKFNGSLIAHVEEKMGKEYAGLLPAEEAKDGRGILVDVDGKQYAICFDDYARHVATGSFIQSIGMKDIIALQLDPRYSKNVGSITIGVSDKQILAMLDSPYFRMVIPYHASGMIPEYAKLVGVSSYNDYTDYQTTKVNKCFDVDGNPVEGFWKADGKKIEIDTHYDFNEAVQRLGDAKAAANEYLEWCKQRHPVYDGKKIVGYATFTAKFSDSPYGTDFTKHENYYKLLEDFNSYDSIGEASALQGAVTMTLPSEATRLTAEQMAEYKQALRDTGLFTEKDIEKYAEKADMTFQELIAEEVGNRAEYESRQAKVWDETVDKAEKMLLEKYRREPAAKTETRDNSIPSVEDVPTEAVVEESDGENAPSLSTRETDPATLKWLNEQVERGDYVVAYKTFLEVQNEDGTVSLYPPMASKQTDETGKRKMANSMAVGEWEKSVGNPNSKNIIEKNGKWYYRLIKDNGKTVDAAYDPYQHSSNVVLNDQFEEAYQRPGLVTYEVIIPKSELTEGYRYSAARDDGRVVEAALPVGEHPWKKGTVAGKLKNTDRTVYMTRWLMPSRRLDNSEVAQMYKDILAKEDSSVPVPFNVVPPGLLTELERIGVPIDYEGSPMYKAHQKRKAEKAVIPAKDSGAMMSSGVGSLSSRDAFFRPREEVDAEYADAVAEGNEDWQKQLVAEAANAAGYTTHAYHGSPIKDITVFRTRSEVDKPQKMQLLFGTHFTTNKAFADLYARKAKNSKGTSRMTSTTGRTYGAYLDLGKSLDLRTAQNYTPGSEMYSLYEDLPENIKKKIQPREFTAYDTSQGLGEGKFITARTIEDALERMTPKAATEFLVSHGFNSVLYDARYNTGSWDNNRFGRDPSIIMLDANRIKSDEPITYDDNGNAIPLSERFNRGEDDIRFSSRDTNAPENSNPYPENTLEHDLLEHARKGDLAEWVTEQMDLNKQAEENSKIRPPVIPTKGFVPRVTEQQKAALEAKRRGLIQKKGAMRPSEKNANGFQMPKFDENNNRFRRNIQNVGSAEQIPQDAVDQLENFAFTDVAATYVPDSNKVMIEQAKREISQTGDLEKSKAQFQKMARDSYDHTVSAQDIAFGEQLLIETSRSGDMQGFLDTLASLVEISTTAGKTLQAFRMLKQSGPIGQLYYMEKVVDRLNNNLLKRGYNADITINKDLAQAVLDAETDDDRDKALDILKADIAKQMPITLKDRLDAWRYFSMLGNFRTHIRNVVGNAIFVPIRFTKDIVAAGNEFLFTKAGLMDQQDRTKAIKIRKEWKSFAEEQAEVWKKELQGNGKYNPAREILEARKVLPGFLDALNRINSNGIGEGHGVLSKVLVGLEGEDWAFLRPAFTRALAMALQNTGYSVKEIRTSNNKEVRQAYNRAIKIAIEEAQKATYRDYSAAASALNRLKRLESDKASGRFFGVLLEGTLPFTKTPINILRRGIEYSPIGLATSIASTINGAIKHNMDGAQIADSLASGLTGTAVMILGWLLARSGILRGKRKDDKEEQFEKLQGYQDYSIQWGDQSFTIDWAAPGALPLFTGAALAEVMDEDEDLELADAWDAMMMIAEPMMSLSMLSGLNDVLSSASYADDNQKLMTIGKSMLSSYLGQMFPTIGGQLARSIDGTRRQTYVDKNSKIPPAMQRFIQSSIQNKMLVWEEKKAPYVDQWGRQSTVDSKVIGAMENFFAPWYRSVVNTTDVDEQLQALYDSKDVSDENLKTILPKSPEKSFKVNGEDKYLTADEYVSFATDVGQTKYKLLTSLLSDARYLALTDDQKALAVKYIYDYSTAAGKYHIASDFDIHRAGKWIEEAEAATSDYERFEIIWAKIAAAIEK